MFSPPETWASTVVIPELESSSTRDQGGYKSFRLSMIMGVIFFLFLTAFRVVFTKPRRHGRRRPHSEFKPMEAVMIPPSPLTLPTPSTQRTYDGLCSPTEVSPASSTTSFISNSSQESYIALPTDFPRGPNVTLTKDQLRQAFYFSPKDRRIIDPAGNYWWKGRKSFLRIQFWKVLFERNTNFDKEPDEAPYALPEWVFKNNLGSEWMDKALYYEYPNEYDSKGRLRNTESKNKPRRDASGRFLSSKNKRMRHFVDQ